MPHPPRLAVAARNVTTFWPHTGKHGFPDSGEPISLNTWPIRRHEPILELRRATPIISLLEYWSLWISSCNIWVVSGPSGHVSQTLIVGINDHLGT